MAEVDREKARNRDRETPFVQEALGKWSSHPEMLAWQRKIFRLIGLLPLVLGVGVAVLILTNYRLSDFANVHDAATLFSALGKLVGKCGWALVALLCALCVTWGFSVTGNMLWGASRRISLSSGTECADRDAMPFPLSILVAAALFWLVPIALPLFKPMLAAIDMRLYLLLLLLSNICCFLPFVLLRIWISVGDDTKKSKDGFRHPYTNLFAWIFYLAIALCVLFMPDVPPLADFVNGAFAKHVNRNCPWVLKVLGTTMPGLFRICRITVALFFAWKSLVHFVKWRLRWVPRRKKSGANRKVPDDGGEQHDESEADAATVPEPVKEVIENLPEGVESGDDIALKSLDQAAAAGEGDDALGLSFLIDLPDGASPTKDQRNFFERFVSSYEEARKEFLEHEDPRAPFQQADLILHGIEGSGRTTILLASALYAAVVRGQRVLYVVPSGDMAESFAARINDRLRKLLVGCYFSVGVLKKTAVSDWLKTYSVKPDKDGRYRLAGDEKLPPDVLFATPEMVERCFFSNEETIDAEKREAMRRMLVVFNLFVFDDFLDYPVAVRSHLAFIVDKFRLLLAAEFVVPQFVVATAPLETRISVDLLGQRLFGFNRFNRNENVYEIHPRPVQPYWCGSLVVKRGTSMASAVRALLRDSLQKQRRTLLYYRGISAVERAKLDEEFKDDVKSGQLKVIGRLGELDKRESYDNVFFLSYAGGNSDESLRLNMSDESSPMFFRVKMEGEDDSADTETMVLLPDETALSLRAFHLRSVLQYIPRLTPVEAGVWSCFGVYGDHPNVKDGFSFDENGPHVDVQWHQDDLSGVDRYAEEQIWTYLVLVANAAISTRGQQIDYNVLPNAFETIMKDGPSDGNAASRVLLVNDGKGDVSRQMVSWRDPKNVPLGESDLAHSEELLFPRRSDEKSAEEEYAFGGMPSQEDIEQEAGRFAMAVTARYRRGTEDEFLFPVKRLSWSVPTRNLEVVDLCKLNGLAQFKIQLKDDVSYRVDGVLKGLLNLKGQEMDFYPPREFGYDAYMTCIVLKPAFRKLKKSANPEDYVRKCMHGTWTTDVREGFSPALTHAMTAVLRRRFSGWGFFALAPVFYIEGREDSVGKAVMWVVEPANSGRTAAPVLKALFEETKFWGEVFEAAHDILLKCKKLWQLRMRSRLAFAEEALEEDDVAKALAILEPLRAKRGEDGDKVEADRKDEDAEAEDESEEASEEADAEEEKKPEARKAPTSYSSEEKEFESVVLEGLRNFNDIIDVTNTAFVAAHEKDPKAIGELFNDVLWNHPEIFYVSKSARYQWWRSSDDKLVKFVIRDIPYGITRSQYPEAKVQLDAAVKDAMAAISSSMSDVEKAKALHDHIVKVCEYDVEARDMNDSSPAARTAYSVLVRHLAVCEGYTMAYRYLLEKVGIKSEEVISDRMNHCWNYVKIGENWYHVDVTWDDPLVNGKIVSGTANLTHEHFLVSDARIRVKEHHDWNVRGLPPATDTTYDSYDWR